MKSKQLLRKEIAEKRKQLDFQWLEDSSARIIEQFLALEEFQSSEIIALYKAIGGEVDLETLFSKVWKRGKRTCIPVFNEKTRVYDMAEITNSTEFKTGNYRIQEPIEPSLLDFSDLDLIAVPGVGFDLAGNRLGRGGGYYDRILPEISGFSVGVAFDFQVFPQIPAESHDRPVHAVLTETKYHKV